MACPGEGGGSSWLPIGSPWVQAAGCTRGMRTVISAASWELVVGGLLMLPGMGSLQPVSAHRPSVVVVVHASGTPHDSGGSRQPLQLM